jgi:hypothetical protein
MTSVSCSFERHLRRRGLLAVWETGGRLPVFQGAVDAGVRLPASKELWARVRLRVHGSGSPGTVNRPLRSWASETVGHQLLLFGILPGLFRGR